MEGTAFELLSGAHLSSIADYFDEARGPETPLEGVGQTASDGVSRCKDSTTVRSLTPSRVQLGVYRTRLCRAASATPTMLYAEWKACTSHRPRLCSSPRPSYGVAQNSPSACRRVVQPRDRVATSTGRWAATVADIRRAGAVESIDTSIARRRSHRPSVASEHRRTRRKALGALSALEMGRCESVNVLCQYIEQSRSS